MVFMSAVMLSSFLCKGNLVSGGFKNTFIGQLQKTHTFFYRGSKVYNVHLLFLTWKINRIYIHLVLGMFGNQRRNSGKTF